MEMSAHAAAQCGAWKGVASNACVVLYDRLTWAQMEHTLGPRTRSHSTLIATHPAGSAPGLGASRRSWTIRRAESDIGYTCRRPGSPGAVVGTCRACNGRRRGRVNPNSATRYCHFHKLVWRSRPRPGQPAARFQRRAGPRPPTLRAPLFAELPNGEARAAPGQAWAGPRHCWGLAPATTNARAAGAVSPVAALALVAPVACDHCFLVVEFQRRRGAAGVLRAKAPWIRPVRLPPARRARWTRRGPRLPTPRPRPRRGKS